MTEQVRNMVVGVTALAGMGVGLFLLLLFGYAPSWLEGGYEIRVHLSNASGLTEGSRVRLSGIDIGRVTSVHLMDNAEGGVEVVAKIRHGVPVSRGVTVRAESPLLGGSPSLALSSEHLTAGQINQRLATDNTAVIQGESLTLASQFAGELEAAMQQPAQQFEKLVERFDVLGQQWTQVGQNVNRLIESRSVDQVASGEAAGNMTTVIARVDQRLDELQSVIQGLSQWVNDEQLHDDVAVAAANTRRLTQRADDSLHRLEQRYGVVADQLAGAIGAARAVVNNTRAGQGTLGRLFYDPSLYDNLNDATQRLQKALDQLNLLAQKWKAEGLPVQF